MTGNAAPAALSNRPRDASMRARAAWMSRLLATATCITVGKSIASISLYMAGGLEESNSRLLPVGCVAGETSGRAARGDASCEAHPAASSAATATTLWSRFTVFLHIGVIRGTGYQPVIHFD